MNIKGGSAIDLRAPIGLIPAAQKQPCAPENILKIGRVRRARGNTLLGFLLGLGVALVVAAAVAFFVYRGDSPFKLSDNPNPPSTALPPIKAPEPAHVSGKIGQPGSEPRQSTAPAAPAPAQQAVSPPPSAPQVVERKPAPPPDGTDAAPKVVAANPDVPKAPPKPDANDSKPIFLQVGAFGSKSEAESRRAMLALMGLEGRVTEITRDDKPIYRVRVGPYTSPDEATRVRGDMARNGIDAVVVR